MDIALLLVFSLVVVLFFVGFWPASRTWKWFHLLLLSLVLISATFYQIFGAMLLKTRTAWGQLHVKSQKELGTAKETNSELIHGTATTSKTFPWATLPLAKNALERALSGRGRTWRNCVTMDADRVKQTVVLRVPVGTAGAQNVPGNPQIPAPAAPVVGAAAPLERNHGIAEHTIVYAFSEGFFKEQFVVPEFFLGEFEVTAVTPEAVSLKATLPLDDLQLQVILARSASWTLYDRSPTDDTTSLDEFLKLNNLDRIAADAAAKNGDGAKAGEVAQYVAGLIRKLPGVSDENYNNLIQQYLREGLAAQQNDAPERVYTEIKFLKPFEVEVDSPNKQVRLDSEMFDLNGLAILPGLRREDKAKFAVGDFAIVNSQKADELANEGICEKVRSIYRRPVRDYRVHFHSLFHRMQYLGERIEELTRMIEDTDKMQKKFQALVDYRTRELAKLQQDTVNVKADLAAVTEYELQLRTEYTSLQGRITGLSESNNKLLEEIASIQTQLSEEITRNSQQAAGGN